MCVCCKNMTIEFKSNTSKIADSLIHDVSNIPRKQDTDTAQKDETVKTCSSIMFAETLVRFVVGKMLKIQQA